MLMARGNRRTFLAGAALAAASPVLTPDLLLAQLSHGAAADGKAKPLGVQSSPDIESLVALIRKTPRAECVAVFVRELQRGLTYHDFLLALFLATFDHGDPHQVAQVYSAHRLASQLPVADRLLPLFWVLDRIALGFEQQPPHSMVDLGGELPAVDRRATVFEDAMVRQDADQAERAIVAVARVHGPRRAIARLWKHGLRRTGGSFGHHPIMIANAFRTLDALNWERAEPVLRYLARSFSQNESDRAYEPNRERVRRIESELPNDWAGGPADRSATVNLHGVLRRGDTDESCDLICTELASRGMRATSAWDAIHLAASDIIFRYKTGGLPIGGAMIHAVTATNALRCGFNVCDDDEVRLQMMLQGVAALNDVFRADAAKDDQLRDMNLLDLPAGGPAAGDADFTHANLEEIFERLPFKADMYTQKSPEERAASDESCRRAFALLSDPNNHGPFMQMARRMLCAKASSNPHDVKYPIAIFEDASSASPEWRPYLLASAVHALHGPASEDSSALVAARKALSR
jgi:hypothetical protein